MILEAQDLGHSVLSPVSLQELEAEEDRLWQEQVQAAKARASSEKERYRRIREVRLRTRALQDTVMRSARERCYVLAPCTLQNAASGNGLTQEVALLRHMLDVLVHR